MKVLLKPVLYLSHYFKQHRQEYYERLQAVRDDGAWLAFFLRGVAEVSQQATESVRQILTLREKHRLIITEKCGRAAGNGHRVLEHLFQHPIVSVNEIKDLIGTTYPAANDLVARLEDNGILREFTGNARNRRFLYQSFINIFHDPDGDSE